MPDHPLAPVGDGETATDRDAAGRFAPGNRAAKGNPHAVRVAALRAALLTTVTPADVEAVIARLVEAAKAGEPWAVRELLDRCIGKAKPAADETDLDDGRLEVVVRHVALGPLTVPVTNRVGCWAD